MVENNVPSLLRPTKDVHVSSLEQANRDISTFSIRFPSFSTTIKSKPSLSKSPIPSTTTYSYIPTTMSTSNSTLDAKTPPPKDILNLILQASIHIVLEIYYLDRQYICDDWFLNLVFIFFFAARVYALWFSYVHDFDGKKRVKGERMWE